jgi:hypothetical protein
LLSRRCSTDASAAVDDAVSLALQHRVPGVDLRFVTLPPSPPGLQRQLRSSAFRCCTVILMWYTPSTFEVTRGQLNQPCGVPSGGLKFHPGRPSLHDATLPTAESTWRQEYLWCGLIDEQLFHNIKLLFNNKSRRRPATRTHLDRHQPCPFSLRDSPLPRIR